MVILMPESFQRKMEADPEFAEEVLKKVQTWKADYDREDNAIAASLGYNPELNQLSKSYCIQLDEDGNVGDYTVTGGGLDDPHESSVTIISRDNPLIIRKTAHQESKVTVSNTLSMPPYLLIKHGEVRDESENASVSHGTCRHRNHA